MMKKIKNLIENSIRNEYVFAVFAKISGVFISLILSALTARFFGAELKGVSAVVENDVTLFSMFLGLGIYQAYPFFKKKEPEIYQEYINNITSFFFICETMVFFIGLIMLKFGANKLLIFAILIVPIEVYIKQLNYILLIENPMKRNISYMIISSVDIVIIIILWFLVDANTITVLIYYLLTVLIKLFLSLLYTNVKIQTYRFSIRRLREFIRFGFLPMWIYICMSINYKIDIQMLKWFEPYVDELTYSAIGIYSVGVSLATKIWLIPDAVKDILLSNLVKIQGTGADKVARIIRINLLFALMSIFLLILLGKPLINLVYGKEFEQVYYVMIFLFIGIVGMIFYKMIYSYNISQGKRGVNLMFLGMSAIINFVGNLFLIPLLHIWGAVIMSVISYSICGICFLIYFHKTSKISYKNILLVNKSDIYILKKFLNNKKTFEPNYSER